MAKHKASQPHRSLFWLPRILSIAFIIFISLFSFDTPVFSTGFVIHSIPSFILILLSLIAWKHERVGASLFLLLFLIFTWFFHTYQDSLVFSLISLPLLIIASLFLVSSKFRS